MSARGFCTYCKKIFVSFVAFFLASFFGCLIFITTAWQDQPVCQESISVLQNFLLPDLLRYGGIEGMFNGQKHFAQK